MEKHRAIPQGYMTVGELAKKMGVTVRTLHHYDKAGLLSPSSESEGGYRLYSDKDVITLHQILAMKYLGFSLDEIKNRMVSLDTPHDVANALTEQAYAIRKKMETLSEALDALEALKTEVLQMESVNFKKYADIVASLRAKSEYSWAIKYADDELLDYLRNNVDDDMAEEITAGFRRLHEDVLQLINDGIPPESDKGQAAAKVYWDMALNFMGGNKSLLRLLVKIRERVGRNGDGAIVDNYIAAASADYFAKLGYNPYEENK